ncbi:acyl-CoA dehydrogenase [uncultured Jatrophihabitans sp.]|uniref:acyl-CoA dehydrogenase family protein n=1 Tax=uncultured Jatrophihabitans sp. TaxID=1610747 RepID=UPI0035CB2555
MSSAAADSAAPSGSVETVPDVGILRALLDGRWASMRERARDLAKDPRFAVEIGEGVEAQREHTLERLLALAEAGHSRLGFPSRYGGANDVGGSITSFEMLAMGDLSLLVKAGVQWGLFGGAILHLGTERHHEKYISKLISGELLGCFAMTETGHGSDVASLRTTATYDPDADEFVIRTPSTAARKEYIGNAARDGHVAVVFAQLVTKGESQGVHAFVVPIRTSDGSPAPGVRIEDCGLKAGLNGVDNGRLYFDDVRIPRDNLLNRYGDVADDGSYRTPIENKTKRFFTMLGTLVQGRISVAGGAGAATKVALAIAIRYGEERRQFAGPDGDEIAVLDYLAHQRKLLPALAKTYALHFAQLALVEGLHDTTPDLDAPRDADPAEHPGRRELEARAAGIKAAATWHATSAIQACREACGGAGYLAENRLPGLKADTDVFTTFEGDNTVLLQLVAKELLTGYRDHFGELDLFGTARFVTDMAFETVVERIGGRRILQRLIDAAPGRGNEEDLRDRAWHLALFDYRESHLLETVARRLQRATSAQDPFAVFNAAQDHMLAAARAHVDSVLLQAFVEAIERCVDTAERELLERVCDLFVLSTIEAERGWFQEHGRLTAARSKAAIAEVNALCGLVRPHARTLVDAFGIPESALAAPIAHGSEERVEAAAR